MASGVEWVACLATLLAVATAEITASGENVSWLAEKGERIKFEPSSEHTLGVVCHRGQQPSIFKFW